MRAQTQCRIVESLRQPTRSFCLMIKSMRRQLAQGNMQQEVSHWLSRETLSKGICQFHKEVGLLFHAPEIFQVMRSQFIFCQKDSPMDKAREENVKVMERYHGERTHRVYSKRQPEHGHRTDIVSDSWVTRQSTNKKRYEVCWKKGSTMIAQPLRHRIHHSV